MSAVLSLIPELERVVAFGSSEKRADTLQRVTTLFLHGAGTYNELHVDLFDDVFGLLIENVESEARAELSVRLASVTNAPPRVLRVLARDDDIVIAGPVLQLSPCLRDADLIDIANTKGRAHLLAIAARPLLSEAVVDVLARRGDPDVARRLADNRGRAAPAAASISYDMQRPAEENFTAPEAANEIADAPPIIGAPRAGATSRDYAAAERAVLGLSSSGRLTEAVLATFCDEGKYEEVVAAFATLAKVPISIADRVMGGERPDPVLILCKAAGFGWPTVKALFLVRPDRKAISNEAFDQAFANYGHLSTSTAQRVVRFWQARQLQ
jgi:uncharacterized protein (DUF2336 family)